MSMNTLNPVVKLLLAACVLGQVTRHTARNYVSRLIAKITINPINPVVDIKPVGLSISGKRGPHCWNRSTIEARQRRNGFNLITTKTKLNPVSCRPVKRTGNKAR